MSSGTNLVMTTIGFSMSILFIVFVCARLIIARIQMSASRRAFRIASRSDPSILVRGLHGLEPIVVASFPTKKYSDTFFSCAEDSDSCIVCLGEYRKEDTLRILPVCGHYFHAPCIDIWLHQHSTCPVCRISLRDLPERNRLMQPMCSSAIRYQHGMEHVEANAYHCLLTRHGLSGTAHDSCRMNSIHEDQFRPENNRQDVEVRSSILSEGSSNH